MAPSWIAELDGTRVTVEVPASSANLGAGYDCLGLALDLTNTVTVEAVEDDLSLVVGSTHPNERA